MGRTGPPHGPRTARRRADRTARRRTGGRPGGPEHEEPPVTAPVFVVERMPTGPEFVLDGPEGRHAVSVRRLQPGEDVVLTDGLGRWAE
ncbi:RNA methyltransferase PUA domain-containing protein, partial [Streptomyces sp. NPDC059346]|uniref:RNA methyltransferase PUA domain-containing protein n=1 Tax=Streptomyces sp. NPDC059346 TaxID=3346807 RepID=UPI0036B4D046